MIARVDICNNYEFIYPMLYNNAKRNAKTRGRSQTYSDSEPAVASPHKPPFKTVPGGTKESSIRKNIDKDIHHHDLPK